MTAVAPIGATTGTTAAAAIATIATTASAAIVIAMTATIAAHRFKWKNAAGRRLFRPIDLHDVAVLDPVAERPGRDEDRVRQHEPTAQVDRQVDLDGAGVVGRVGVHAGWRDSRLRSGSGGGGR